MKALTQHAGDFREFWQADLPAGAVGLAWLGQAGFGLRWGQWRVVIDPYLSDSLEEKYRGKEFAHRRMMPAPVQAAALTPVDLVLCTHAHTDHMDAQTLGPMAEANRTCQFVVPEAAQQAAMERGVPTSRMRLIDAGRTIEGPGGMSVFAVAGAHEHLEVDAQGRHRFLGYVLSVGGHVIYHSGDTVVHSGLTEAIRGREIDLALLPVNGRDIYRASRGVPGNMDFDEAVELCRQACISRLVPHHFGMFDFNTADPETLHWKIAKLNGGVDVALPSTDRYMVLE